LETIVLISPAYAQGAPAGVSGPGYEQFFIIIGMFALLYFLMIRPQMKRSKEHKQMTEALQKGDEVITSGGVLGKITRIGDAYISLEIAPNTEVQVQRTAVQTLLPKGTIKSI
jgi:preprotein translocase subunit YajC